VGGGALLLGGGVGSGGGGGLLLNFLGQSIKLSYLGGVNIPLIDQIPLAYPNPAKTEIGSANIKK